MRRIAIGDVQGCLTELKTLLDLCKFNPAKDQLWFVGDLVNRGPDSLGVLRFVRSLGDSARVVLGNHDLHLLAVAFGDGKRPLREGDTLDDILQAPDRDTLLEWLIARPLAIAHGSDLMVHAGVIPAWSPTQTLELAAEVEQQLQTDPKALFENMYGDEPRSWSPSLAGFARWRFIINALTRMRYCHADGRIDLKMKGAPGTQKDGWLPWFDIAPRATEESRIIFGHWSTLGLLERANVLALDTGCVWGGSLSAANLDDVTRWRLDCPGHREPG
jgi:bis(5'-nucleosyl)-tetraphosphatase (symmetrical)